MKNKYFTIIKTVLLISISLLFNSTTNGQSPNDGYNLIKNGGIEYTTSPWDFGQEQALMHHCNMHPETNIVATNQPK